MGGWANEERLKLLKRIKVTELLPMDPIICRIAYIRH